MVKYCKNFPMGIQPTSTYIHTGFIELWQQYKAGFHKHTHIHTNRTLQVNEIKHKTKESYRR